MNTNIRRKTHPLVLTAAAAVTVFSVIGSAAITGMIPSAHSERHEYTTAAATTSPAAAEQPFHSAVSGSSRPQGAPAQGSQVQGRERTSPATAKSAVCKVCGVIESIATVEHEGDGSGLGAVAGGVVGGVAGNQVGKGKGNTLMTIIGLGGGAYAGHAIEKKMKSSTSYVVKVRMEDGSYRKVTQIDQPSYAVGDHVRVVSGSITST